MFKIVIKYIDYKLNTVPLIIISIISLVFSVEVLAQCIINYKHSYLNGYIDFILVAIMILLIIFYGMYHILSLNKRLILKDKFSGSIDIVSLILIFSMVITLSIPS